MSNGINVYDQVKEVAFGSLNEQREIEKRAATKEPCIFLSHKSEDKDPVKAVGEYIMNAGINVYLDAADAGLQQAVRDKDDAKITKYIERGIKFSTDLMVFISEKTKSSWWVPYEIGFGKNAGKFLARLKLKSVTNLPPFLSIVRQIDTREQLNAYLKEVKQRVPAVQMVRDIRDRQIYAIDIARGQGNVLMEARGYSHPLEAYVD